MQEALTEALRTCADAIKAKVSANAEGEPEAQLSGPVSALIEEAGRIIGSKVVAKAESRLADRLGIPDFGVLVDGALCGYVELKAPGEGANTARFRGRNKDQWERFKSQPNIIYTDGTEWAVYQRGESAERLLTLSKDVTKHGRKAISDEDGERFRAIITKFLSWSPLIPEKPKDQASLLAPLCALLRQDVADALRDPQSPLVTQAREWRHILFPDADDERFADSYAQTVTFALLLSRSEGADVSDISRAVAKLEADHTLLSRALQFLTDTQARKEIDPSLRLLQRVISAFPKGAMKAAALDEEDPWLYFYEHFLSSYDPKLRKNSGVYYTPVQVVKCQVALIDDLLRHRLNRSGGFTHKDVITLDPAVGTGTYLLGVIDRALEGVEAAQGKGAIPAKATALAANLYGFEFMTGPYAVSELRLTRALNDRGATLPKDGLGVYLTDTLESPFGKPPDYGMLMRPLTDQHKKALEVKDKKTVIVCLGNPPYDRHDAVQYVGDQVAMSDRARTGGWVRWGDKGDPAKAILAAFIDPAKNAGHGGDLKNLYNLYVYFWRWALWKVFQHTSDGETRRRSGDAPHAGVVSFISASSYIRGDAFVGMREMLRRLCHEIWIIDLGGEGRGTRKDANVFDIQTPVAICIALREGKKDTDARATVRYASILGTQEEKYEALASIKSFDDLTWKDCPTEWHAPMRPAGVGPYFNWPLLTDLMPWQSNGVQLKRLWPIGVTEDQLHQRWKALLLASDRRKAMRESGDRTVHTTADPLPGLTAWSTGDQSIAQLSRSAPCGPVVRYAYRSLDRQHVIADARLIARPRPPLWLAHSDRQVYFTSVFTNAVAVGPTLTACGAMPDLHHFRGSFGAKDAFPLYRDVATTEPNILPGLLGAWSKRLKREISPDSFAAYVYALLAHPAFAKRFWDELEERELRVPLTLDGRLFDEAVSAGERLLFLHTYGERYTGKGRKREHIPRGAARCIETISEKPADYPEKFEYLEGSQTLRVGTGAVAPVPLEVWGYEVSGLRIMHSWLGYRMKDRKGKKSSPLDDIHPERWTSEFTDELLRLLWILEQTIAMHGDLAALLDKVCAGPLVPAKDLPPVPEAMRKPPRAGDAGLFDPGDSD